MTAPTTLPSGGSGASSTTPEVDPVRAYALSCALEQVNTWPNQSDRATLNIASKFEAYLRGTGPQQEPSQPEVSK